MLSDRQGHRGSRLRACLIVLEALICQGSAGNQVGLHSATSVFIGRSVPCLSKEDIFPLLEDALMIKVFLVSFAQLGDEHIRLIFSSCPHSLSVFAKLKPSSKINLKYVFGHANTRMFGNFSPQVVVTSGVCALPEVGQQ